VSIKKEKLQAGFEFWSKESAYSLESSLQSISSNWSLWKQMEWSIVDSDMILTRQTCGQHSSRVLAFYFSGFGICSQYQNVEQGLF